MTASFPISQFLGGCLVRERPCAPPLGSPPLVSAVTGARAQTPHLQHMLLVNAVVEHLGRLLDGDAAFPLPGDVGLGVPVHLGSEHSFISCSGHRTRVHLLASRPHLAPAPCLLPGISPQPGQKRNHWSGSASVCVLGASGGGGRGWRGHWGRNGSSQGPGEIQVGWEGDAPSAAVTG